MSVAFASVEFPPMRNGFSTLQHPHTNGTMVTVDACFRGARISYCIMTSFTPPHIFNPYHSTAHDKKMPHNLCAKYTVYEQQYEIHNVANCESWLFFIWRTACGIYWVRIAYTSHGIEYWETKERENESNLCKPNLFIISSFVSYKLLFNAGQSVCILV